MFKMPETDIAWAAGFFDGEGYTGGMNRVYTYEGYKHRTRQFNLQVGQVHREPLDKLVRILGGKVYGPYASKSPRANPAYYWRIATKKLAEEALVKMWPHLSIIKRVQAIRALGKYEQREEV